MLTMQVLWNALIAGSLYALVAVGFGLTYNIGNFFNMAHGVSFLVGGYTGYFAFRVLGLGLPTALISSALLAGVLAIGLQHLVFEKLGRRRSSRLVLFIASLGILIITEGLVATLFGNQAMTFRSGPSLSFEVPGGRLTSVQLVILLLSVAAFMAMYLFFQKTDAGRGIRAVSDDRDLAVVVGISVQSVVSKVQFWGAALASTAGVLVGLEHSVKPSSGMTAILWATVASIVGGVGSFTGPILGGFVLGGLESTAITFLPSEWKNTAVFSVLILFLFFRPRGLWGR